MTETVQLNARVEKELAEQLDQLASITGRKKVWHLNEALRAYIQQRGRADARAGRTRDFDVYAAELKQRIADRQE
jgi:predicted transcriptional regulator